MTLANRMSLLPVIHLVNALWMTRVFWLGWGGNFGEVNFLTDRPLVALLVSCAALHFARWRALATEHLDAAFSSSTGLRQQMERVAREMYGSVPYLVSPVPNDKLLQRHAEALVASSSTYLAPQKKDLMLAVLNVDWLIAAHCLGIFLFAFGLAAPGFDRYGSIFRAFWPLQGLFIVIAAGLLIYCMTTLLFSIVFNRERK
jgi:hypothetical protein